jgi:hypothetical protein
LAFRSSSAFAVEANDAAAELVFGRGKFGCVRDLQRREKAALRRRRRVKEFTKKGGVEKVQEAIPGW